MAATASHNNTYEHIGDEVLLGWETFFLSIYLLYLLYLLCALVYIYAHKLLVASEKKQNQKKIHHDGLPLNNATTSHQVWAKDLPHGDVAVLAFNRGSAAINISVAASAIGPAVADTSGVRDIWTHTDVHGVISANQLRVHALKPHDSVFYRISPKSGRPSSLTPSLTAASMRKPSVQQSSIRKFLTHTNIYNRTGIYSYLSTAERSLRACIRVRDQSECAIMTPCEQRCAAAGHCCVGTISAYQHPSCVQGCLIAQQTKTRAACEAKCLAADGKCEWKLNGTEMHNCQSCPSTCCNAVTKDECKQGCAFAYSFN